MRRSQVVANEVLTLISRPLVTNFVRYSNSLNQNQIEDLINQVNELTDGTHPITWRLILDMENAPALARYIQTGRSVTIANVIANELLPKSDCIPLLLQRNSLSELMPDKSNQLELGDELLVCMKRNRINLMQRMSHNDELVDSLVNHNPHQIPLLRWMSRRQQS